MPRLTPSTITTIDEFLAELEKVRDQGYAVDDTENQADGRCVAVAILDLPFSAGLSVSAPASRLAQTDVPAIAKQLRRIEAKLASQMRQ
jgi:IclR family acetate operon transcriptional repressor